MEKWKRRAVNLLSALAFGSDGTPSVIPYYPQKTKISSHEHKYFARSVPERHGISSRRIYSMLCSLETEPRANVQGLMVLCGGEVISECARDGYDLNMWRLSHSMSKTVTGMAIGMLVDEGKLRLTERLVDIFPEIPYKDKNFPQITVEHLLAMTSGVTFGEAGSVTEAEWTRAFFNSPLKFVPGSAFAYNSMNSYILARIVVQRSGEGLVDFLTPRLFLPLHITNRFWELSPEGYEKGGWGLYMSVESWAKLGQLVLRGGVFDGVRILSEHWVDESTKKQANSPVINGDFNYGYHLWVDRADEDVLFNGMLGQNVWICPKNDIVVVMICGNNELFQDSPALEIIRKHLGGDIYDGDFDRRDLRVLHERETRFFDYRRAVMPLEKKHGLLYWLGVRNRTAYDEKWDDLIGEYAFADNNVGFLPLFVRGMQNNLESHLERMKFERYKDGLYLTFRESGEYYRVEIGLYEYKEAVLNFRGERYIVRIMGEAVVDTHGECEYRIEAIFAELPNVRMIRIRHVEADKIRVEFTENPNNRMADALLERATAAPPLSIGLDLLERRFGDGFINRKVEDVFAPVLVGANISSERFDKIISDERARAAEQSKTVKLIRSLVSRFFGDEERTEEKKESQRSDGSGGIIGDIVSRIKDAFFQPRGAQRSDGESRDGASAKPTKAQKRAERYLNKHRDQTENSEENHRK